MLLRNARNLFFTKNVIRDGFLDLVAGKNWTILIVETVNSFWNIQYYDKLTLHSREIIWMLSLKSIIWSILQRDSLFSLFTLRYDTLNVSYKNVKMYKSVVIDTFLSIHRNTAWQHCSIWSEMKIWLKIYGPRKS